MDTMFYVKEKKINLGVYIILIEKQNSTGLI